jgi:hypothetical protein
LHHLGSQVTLSIQCTLTVIAAATAARAGTAATAAVKCVGAGLSIQSRCNHLGYITFQLAELGIHVGLSIQ